MPQKNWDKYEVALLIETYQNIKQGRVDRNTALVALSQNLRQIAINEGLEIDDTFRNLNGMQWQMGFIERAFVGEDYESRIPPHIFVEMVALYNDNKAKFQEILDEAHSKIVGKKETNHDGRKQLFIEWLAGQNIPSEAVIQNIEYVCEYAVKRNITKKNVWDIDDSREFNVIRVKISGNRLFKLMHGKEHRQFEKNGKLYSDFLKANSEKAEMPIKKGEHPEETIAETAVTVPQEPIAVSEEIQSPPPDSQKQSEQVLDLCNIPDLSYTKPTFATFKGIELDAYNWKIAYISVLNILYRVYSVRLNNYIGKSFGCGTRIDLSYNSADLISPKLISSEHSVYAESNLSAYDIAKRIATVLKICGVSYDRLVIRYKKIERENTNDDGIQSSVPQRTEGIVHTYISSESIKILNDYMQWLIDERGMSKNSGKSCGSALRFADIHAQEMHLIDKSLFEIADEALKETIGYILSDANFAEFNAKKHNRFSAALNAYLMFKTGERAIGKKYGPSLTQETQNDVSEEVKSDSREYKSFLDWMILGCSMAESTSRSYYSAIKVLSEWALDKGLITKSLFDMYGDDEFSRVYAIIKNNDEFKEFNANQHNRFTAALAKYAEYIFAEQKSSVEVQESSIDLTPIKQILIEKFSRGIRITSKIDLNKFRRILNENLGEESNYSDEDLVRYIQASGFSYEGKVYAAEALVEKDVEESIRQFVDSNIEQGKTVLYYAVIYNEFAHIIEDTLFNTDILREYLKYLFGNKYYFRKKYLAIDGVTTPDVYEEVVQFLKSSGRPTTVAEICETLSHIEESRIRQILNFYAEIIYNDRDCYYYVEVLPIGTDELAAIRDFLSAEIARVGYASGKDLLNGLIIKYPATYDRLRIEYTDKGIRKGIAFLLSNDFEIDNNIISAKGNPMSCSDVFAKYCAERDHFTIDDLNMLTETLGFGTVIYFEPVYDNSLRINKDEFVAKKYANFDVAATDAAIGHFCIGDYITISEVTNFSAFPSNNFPWNSFLLEHYVSKYSEEYKLVSMGHTANKSVGAIVKRISPLDTFDEIITDALRNANVDNRDEALEYLVQNGFLARRKYTKIDDILKAARRVD